MCERSAPCPFKKLMLVSSISGSTWLGGALEKSNRNTFVYRTLLEIDYAESLVRMITVLNYHFRTTFSGNYDQVYG